MARSITLPKRFSLILFFLGLSAALISAGYVTDLTVMLLEGLTGKAGSIDGTASLWAIIIAAVVVILMAKSARSIVALLAGYVVGCFILFMITLPGGAF